MILELIVFAALTTAVAVFFLVHERVCNLFSTNGSGSDGRAQFEAKRSLFVKVFVPLALLPASIWIAMLILWTFPEVGVIFNGAVSIPFVAALIGMSSGSSARTPYCGY